MKVPRPAGDNKTSRKVAAMRPDRRSHLKSRRRPMIQHRGIRTNRKPHRPVPTIAEPDRRSLPSTPIQFTIGRDSESWIPSVGTHVRSVLSHPTEELDAARARTNCTQLRRKARGSSFDGIRMLRLSFDRLAVCVNIVQYGIQSIRFSPWTPLLF